MIRLALVARIFAVKPLVAWSKVTFDNTATLILGQICANVFLSQCVKWVRSDL